jgi:hypothetical protein
MYYQRISTLSNARTLDINTTLGPQGNCESWVRSLKRLPVTAVITYILIY